MAVDARTFMQLPTGVSHSPLRGLRARGQTAGVAVAPALVNAPPSAVPRLLVFVLLVAAAAIDTGPSHGPTHWLVLAVYGVGTVVLAYWREGSSRKVAWSALGLDAALAIYVLAESAGVSADGLSRVPDMLGQLPALLLLLQTGLTLSVTRTLVFSGLVAASWGGIVIFAVASGWPPVIVQLKLFGLVAFLAACLFVVHGVRRLRQALASATRSELERASLARFVPAGKHVDLVRRGSRSLIEARSASMLAIDIRGFSDLTRRYGASRLVNWLLDVRALVHSEVTTAGGIVDKYVGDGVLALFLDGPPHRQAEAALGCAVAIRSAIERYNLGRHPDLPAMHLTAALHAGGVLAGVFDDGLRAEFSVLGPAMNALSRIERRAKKDGLDLVSSKRFARLLDPTPMGLTPRRLDRARDDDDCPDLISFERRNDDQSRRLKGGPREAAAA